MKKHYLIEIEGAVEPTVHGPYKTEDECDNSAKQIRRRQEEDDGLFWADIDDAGVLSVGSYSAGFFSKD